ncbi:MAG: PQQ-binding-like beta-propeller repeat protein [Gemmataceae bacterium]
MTRRTDFRRLLFPAFLLVLPAVVRADDWPQWLGPQRDGVWRETGIIKKFPEGGPPVVWRKPVGEGYAGPAVADGRVYVTDWVMDKDAKRPASAFAKSKLPGTEHVFCLDEKTGDVLWTHSYDCPYQVSYPAGPRCTPTVKDGKVYTLGTMGDLFCLDATKGAVIWSKNFVKDYQAKVPLWGFAGHPLIEGDRLICLAGGNDGDSLAVAFNKDTGKEIWRALTTLDTVHGPGYAPPVIAEVGKIRQLIVWEAKGIHGLDPATGKVYWSQPFELNAGMSIATPRVVGDRLFVSAFYNGPMMLQLAQDKPAARVLWRGRSSSETKTDGLHTVMMTPMVKDGYIYGTCSYGQLRCLNVNTGERVWESLAATGGKEVRWGNAFIVAHEDHYFLFNERGELIIANLSPDGYQEISRTKLIEPTNKLAGRNVVWMHPAFADKSVFARNDKEIIRVSLAEK